MLYIYRGTWLAGREGERATAGEAERRARGADLLLDQLKSEGGVWVSREAEYQPSRTDPDFANPNGVGDGTRPENSGHSISNFFYFWWSLEYAADPIKVAVEIVYCLYVYGK